MSPNINMISTSAPAGAIRSQILNESSGTQYGGESPDEKTNREKTNVQLDLPHVQSLKQNKMGPPAQGTSYPC